MGVFIYHVVLLAGEDKTVGPEGPAYIQVWIESWMTGILWIFCIQGPLIFNPLKKEEIWRFLTYMFVHSGYFHIVFNVLIQVSRSFSLTYV